jgi:hypothetical protein
MGTDNSPGFANEVAHLRSFENPFSPLVYGHGDEDPLILDV